MERALDLEAKAAEIVETLGWIQKVEQPEKVRVGDTDIEIKVTSVVIRGSVLTGLILDGLKEAFEAGKRAQ